MILEGELGVQSRLVGELEMSMKKKMLQERHRLHRGRNITAKAAAVVVCEPEFSCVAPEGRSEYCDWITGLRYHCSLDSV